MLQSKISSFFVKKPDTPDLPIDDVYDPSPKKSPQINVTYSRRLHTWSTKGGAVDEELVGVTGEAQCSQLLQSSLKYGALLNRKRSYAQFHLDLGQSDFLLKTCSLCGFVYTPGVEGDERNHVTFHKNYTHGIQFKGWKNERVVNVTPFESGRILLVMDGDTPFQIKKVHDVVRMMEIDLGGEWIWHKKCKAYLLITSHRVSGCLIAEPIKAAHRVIIKQSNVSPTKRTEPVSASLQFGKINFQRETVKRVHCPLKSNGAVFCENDDVPAVCGIRAIWVSPSNRGQHLATCLLDAVRKTFCPGFVLEPSQLAFSQLTSAGVGLASSYTRNHHFLVYKGVQWGRAGHCGRNGGRWGSSTQPHPNLEMVVVGRAGWSWFVVFRHPNLIFIPTSFSSPTCIFFFFLPPPLLTISSSSVHFSKVKFSIYVFSSFLSHLLPSSFSLSRNRIITKPKTA